MTLAACRHSPTVGDLKRCRLADLWTCRLSSRSGSQALAIDLVALCEIMGREFDFKFLENYKGDLFNITGCNLQPLAKMRLENVWCFETCSDLKTFGFCESTIPLALDRISNGCLQSRRDVMEITHVASTNWTGLSAYVS